MKSNRRRRRQVLGFALIFPVFLSLVASCSVGASSKTLSSPQETAAATPESVEGTDGAHSRDALPGDARLEEKRFSIYMGAMWHECGIPSGFTLGFSEKNGRRFTSLTSLTNPAVSILFSLLTDLEEVPDMTALRNQLNSDKPSAEVKPRGDIGNWGEAPAVAAQVTTSDGNVGIVAVAEIDGRIWSVTVNAQNEQQANELYDAVQGMKPSEDSPDSVEEKPLTVKPSLSVALRDETLVVDIGNESVNLTVPESFTAFEDEEADVVGGADRADARRSITFTADMTIQTTSPSKLMARIRESSLITDAAEIATVPSVSSVAGREAGAVDMALVNGMRSRLYIVRFETSYIQIVVNEPSGDAEALNNLSEIVGDAR